MEIYCSECGCYMGEIEEDNGYMVVENCYGLCDSCRDSVVDYPDTEEVKKHA